MGEDFPCAKDTEGEGPWRHIADKDGSVSAPRSSLVLMQKDQCLRYVGGAKKEGVKVDLSKDELK